MHSPSILFRASAHTGVAAILLGGLFGLAGCGGKAGDPKMSIKDGNHQASPAGSREKPARVKSLLRVMIQRHIPGLLGGKGTKKGVPKQKVTFEVVGGAQRAVLVGKDGTRGPSVSATSDQEGVAGVYAELGPVVGDVVVEAKWNGKKMRFRIASGVQIEGNEQEGGIGAALPEPIRIRLTDAEGNPRAGVPVRFKIQKGSKAKISPSLYKTDKDGWAQATLTLGEATERNRVEILPAGEEVYYMPMEVKAFAIGGWGIFLKVVGGLAIFIWGMHMMSSGLQRVAGDRLRSILEGLIRNRFSGVLVGAAATALVQSSSATTVMIVGFVNAGLLRLEAAIATVMGTNIGTTVTAQIVAFQLKEAAGPAVAAGVILYMFSTRRSRRFWAQVLIGFGLLFIGLSVMSDTLKVLKDSPGMVSWFESASCAPLVPGGHIQVGKALLGVLVGTVVTIAVQSSSASIGLLLSLASAGLLDFYTVIPILLGDNIGTTITAQLAAIGTNRTARQTAHAHTIFNVIGAGLMMVFFFVHVNGRPIFLEFINTITPGDAWGKENLERHIANSHTVFNIANTLLHLPFVVYLAVLCRKITAGGEDEEDEKPVYLEPHLLDTPPVALARVRSELVYMLQLARKSIEEAFSGLVRGPMKPEEVARIRSREGRIDQRQIAISDYMQRLTQRSLTEEESREVPPLIHAVNDLERVGDHAENLLDLEERMRENGIELPAAAVPELEQMAQVVFGMFDCVHKALETRDTEAAMKALAIEKEINKHDRLLSRASTARLERGECSVAAGVIYLDVVNCFEKVGDHLTNVAGTIAGQD